MTLSINLSPLRDAMQVTQGVAIVLDDLTEKKRLEGQYKLFERMVSPKVIHQLDPDKIQLGGKRMKITTLFADIRGFTSFSESQNPEQLVWILNRYLAIAAEAVLAQEGTIDKFMGDGVMAWFNAPIPQPDHIIRSIRTALGIQQAVKNLHKDLPDHYHLFFGIGVHFGDAVLGLIGSERQVEYTAVGDSVNTAKRLQENALAGQILISEAVYKNVQYEIRARKVEPIDAKGKRELLEVYELLELC
jgi:class 3 adenylate cyclase